MSRAFSGTGQYLTGGSLPSGLSGTPFTMACWFNPDDTSTSEALMSLSTNGGTARWQVEANVTAAKLGCAAVNSAGTTGRATTTASFSAGAWNHAAAVFTSSTSRTIYLNGGNSVSNATNVSPTADRTVIGARISAGSFGALYKGKLAHVSIWNVALSAGEIAQLAAKVSPFSIQKSALVFHACFWGSIVESVGSMSLSDTGPTTDDSADPGIIYLPRNFALNQHLRAA